LPNARYEGTDAAAPLSTDDALADHIMAMLETDAPIEVRMALLADAMRSVDPAASGAIDRMAERLREGGAGIAAPQLGTVLPPFALPDETGRVVLLDSLLGAGPLVVVFLRGHWCPYCRVAARALAASERAIAASGGRLVAITPERQRYSNALRTESGLACPLLSDIDNAYALSLGLAIWIGQELQTLMEGRGRNLPRYHGSAAWLLPLPATFVLDRDGVVVERHVDPDYRQRMPRERILAAVRHAAG
jgi:peroxiredoxin